MRGVVMYGPGDVRVEDREDPRIELPTDAVIRLAATCVCGSDPHHQPGRVFDLHLPLEQAPEAYRAMDQRQAIKALLQPWA